MELVAVAVAGLRGEAEEWRMVHKKCPRSASPGGCNNGFIEPEVQLDTWTFCSSYVNQQTKISVVILPGVVILST